MWRLLAFLAAVVGGVLVGGSAAAIVLPENPSFVLQLTVYHAVLGATALAVSAAMMWKVEREPLALLGLRLGPDAVRDFGRGALVGTVIMGGLVAIQLAAGGLVPEPDAGGPSAWAVRAGGLAVVLLIAAGAEELLFRGYALQVLVQAVGAVPAVLLSAAAFAALHGANPAAEPLSLLNVGLAGVLLGVVYLRSWSLWLVTGLHWAWNWTMGVGFDLPVSGIRFDMPAYDLQAIGPRWLTGGEFGPEGAMLTSLALVLATLWATRAAWLGPLGSMRAVGTLIQAPHRSRAGAVRSGTGEEADDPRG